MAEKKRRGRPRKDRPTKPHFVGITLTPEVMERFIGFVAKYRRIHQLSVSRSMHAAKALIAYMDTEEPKLDEQDAHGDA